MNDLKEKLQYSEGVVADLRKILQQRDSELETLKTKVKNVATHNDTPSYVTK